MDPHRDSPLDEWARKHLSVASAQSLDLLSPFPPPVPDRRMRALPPIPDEFDFRAPKRGALTSPSPHSKSQPSLQVTRKRDPPMPFNFNSLNDHLRMAIYQIEAGTDQWAKVHIDHAAAKGSLIGLLLRAAGAKASWWPHQSGEPSDADLNRISALELQSLAGEPSPRLAGALYDFGYPQLASLLETGGTPDPASAPPNPFARTHGRSNSSQTLNSSHMFPYPWRDPRNNSQTSLNH